MENTLIELRKSFLERLSQVSDLSELSKVKADFLTKKDEGINAVLKGMKDVSPEIRKEIGSKANTLKVEMESLLSSRMEELEITAVNAKLEKEKIDITFRESLLDLGLNACGCHPVSIVQREIEDIFVSMGFGILDGPHIEDDWHNFGALNVPANHPARDMQDTFWFADMQHLLRTHTSAVQVRGMEANKPPFKFIGPGKVFRCEATDASHEMVFHQLEGMMVGKDISVANLIYFMKTLLSEIFKKEVEVRLRPGFFPFVEPGFELDIKCLICGGKGCPVCKHSGWVELLPCGMVHPNVLKAGGIDPTEFNGFAFGLGLDRLVMMRYGIDDIRHLHGADLRFISQFKSC